MIAQVTTHVADARGRVISQYKDSPNFQTALDALVGEQTQALENAAFTVFNKWDIDAATENLLDDIGELVGQKRQGQADDLYRVFIKARIGANTSEGAREKILSIWKLMIPGAKVTIFETYPASLDIYTDIPLDAALVSSAFGLIQEVAVGGVQVGFTAVYSTVAPFGFAEGTDLGTSGFGNLITQGVNTSVTVGELVHSGGLFITGGVLPGMIVRNEDTGLTADVVSVPTESRLILTVDIFPLSSVPYLVSDTVGGSLSFIQGA